VFKSPADDKDRRTQMPDGVNGSGSPRQKLILHVAGAREDELTRGLSAADAVLYRDGDINLQAAMAANGYRDFIMFDEDQQPINDITEEQHRLATLWETALSAALDACCAGWSTEPANYWLGIDTGADTTRPWYVEKPIATFTLKDGEGDHP
jgi:hypothetical protein